MSREGAILLLVMAIVWLVLLLLGTAGHALFF